MIKSELDIVLPIYNPHNGWEIELIERYQKLSDTLQDINFRLIMVNDGSSVDLSQAIEKIQDQILDVDYIHYTENRGKGYALRQGVQKTTAPTVLFTDYDFPYELESMHKMISRFFEQDLEVAIAQRDETYYGQIVKRRSYISNLLKSVNKLLLRLPVSDTQGGLKMFNSQGRAAFLATTTDRYLIDIDFLKRVHRKGLSITPVIVKLRPEIELTNISNMRLLKELGSYLKIIAS